MRFVEIFIPKLHQILNESIGGSMAELSKALFSEPRGLAVLFFTFIARFAFCEE